MLKYLPRYTHRAAISNRRLLSLEDGHVTFRWKNYAEDNRKETMTLSAVEFLRRFFLHLVPPHFVRIRHYGFLANRHRADKLACCRELLGVTLAASALPSPVQPEAVTPEETHDPEPKNCPVCGGRMRCVERTPRPSGRQLLRSPWPWNSS